MENRTQLIREITEARASTDAMFRWIRPDSLYRRPVPERHRFIFYVGHLEAFDWNLIGRTTLGLSSVQEDFDRLFAFGIDPPPGQLPQDQPSDWPRVKDIQPYISGVRRKLDEVWQEVPGETLHVAKEHRLMHVETLSYILHNLEPERKILPTVPLQTSGPTPAHRFIPIPEGIATLGRSPKEGFRWDNECELQSVRVPAFGISKYKVTNRQFLEFVLAGGPIPHFWVQRKGQWYWRAMSGEIPLSIEWPVYVTWDLAQAYATWVGKALPTEAQFHRAAYGTPNGVERLYPWGTEPPDSRHGHFDCRGWDPVPVTAHPQGDSAFGVTQLVGNGWEWTSTVFHPLEGFQAFSFYPGYSAPFFDGAHYVVKGGSGQTALPFLRRSFRNWFRGSYPYVYAGFRCIEN